MEPQDILSALRPLFPDNFHAEVYVNIVLFSADGIDMPDALAGLAASAALAVSDIPFGGPISEVRFGMRGDEVEEAYKEGCRHGYEKAMREIHGDIDRKSVV